MKLFLHGFWWACVTLMVLSLLADVDGVVPRWICLTWVLVAALERLTRYMREAGK